MSKIYGYMRVSSKGQNVDRQEVDIRAFAERMNYEIDYIFEEKQSGKDFNREEYEKMKRTVVENDIIILSELDRLGRNKEQMKEELNYYNKLGVRVVLLDVPTTQQDFTKMEEGIAKAMLEMVNNLVIEVLSTLAEQERLKIKKRQADGIRAAKIREKKEGVSIFGRPKKLGDNVTYAIQMWESKDYTVSHICSVTGIARATLYRRLRERGLMV